MPTAVGVPSSVHFRFRKTETIMFALKVVQTIEYFEIRNQY